MASIQKTITFPEPLRAWIQAIADKRGIPFATAVAHLLQEAREARGE